MFPKVCEKDNSGRSLLEAILDLTFIKNAFVKFANIPNHSKGSENACGQKSYLTLELPFTIIATGLKVCNQTS